LQCGLQTPKLALRAPKSLDPDIEESYLPRIRHRS
jgi:hypothetical protein